MNITFISTGSRIDVFPPTKGGIEILEFDLIKELKKRGNTVQLFASKSELENSIEIGSNISFDRIHNFYSMVNCWKKKSLVQGEILHCHYPLTAYPFLGKPLVYSEHNWYNLPKAKYHKTLFTPMFSFFQQKVYEKADRIIALSSEIKEIIQEKIPERKNKVVFIPNFVDSGIFVPAKKQENKILFVGRLDKEKNLEMLIEVLGELKNKFDFELEVIGEGPERKKLESQAKKAGIKCNFFGFVSHKELAFFFSTASVFVLPSFFEVMPVVVLEAMSSGCAVIASNAFGIKDQIDSGKNGLVFKKGKKEELKNHLIDLLSSSTLCSSFGSKAREKVLKEFDVKVIAEKTEKLYREVLEERKQKA
ncbi:glycosyltransferase family 4 protein [Candidatus Micrarchaeota archaeon]|nr:glycosyltransferase family 4 protein [Candidatus Micrarchaeota archaeon]MBU2475908.1 glycosyltransferase family 4 protein [Candidatus Micrarchaeota archaeon]